MAEVLVLFQDKLQVFQPSNPLTLQRRPESGIRQLLHEDFDMSIAQLLGRHEVNVCSVWQS
jgi:hypothetical protein